MRACHFNRHCLWASGLQDSELKLDLAGLRKRPRLGFYRVRNLPASDLRLP